MNYYGSKDLADSFRTVRKNTIVIAEDIPEAQYGPRAAPETRSVAELLVHIAVAPGLQERIQGAEKRTTLEGFDFMGLITQFIAMEKEPRSKAQIIELLRTGGERFASLLDGLSDDFLGQRVSMPAGMTPARKTPFEMLLGVKEHKMHPPRQLMQIHPLRAAAPPFPPPIPAPT